MKTTIAKISKTVQRGSVKKYVRKTNSSASTSPSRGAVHPSISPGESGFERGIVASYFPDHSIGWDSPGSVISSIGVVAAGPSINLAIRGIAGAAVLSCVRSSFRFCSAATNWMVETRANRVGSCEEGPAVLLACSVDPSEGPSIRRCRIFPMICPVGT